MVQTSISNTLAIGLAGQLAQIGDHQNVVESWTNREAAAAGIPFGIGVARHTVARCAEEFDAVTDKLLGIAVRSHAHDAASLAGSLAIATGNTFGVLRKGFIYVAVEEAVSDGDPAFCRFTSDGGDNAQLGTWRKSIDSNRARRVRGAVFRSAASAGGIALLEVDFGREDAIGEELAHFEYTEIAQMTADTTRPFINTPSDRYLVLSKAQIRNETGLAADAANYFNAKIQTPAGAVAFNWSTLDSAEGALVADTAHEMTAAALSARTFNPGSELEIFFDETGTATMPAGTTVSAQGYYL